MAPTPLRTTLVHRLPGAAVLALAIALVGGGAIGFATAADGNAIAFSVPAPHAGDEAQYAPVGRADEEPRRIEILPAAPLLMPDGRWLSVAEMKTSQHQSSDLSEDFEWMAWRSAYLDLATGDVVASAYSDAAFRGSAGTDGPGDLDSAVVVNQRSSELKYAAGPVPCGSLNGLQDRLDALASKVWVAGCFPDEDRRDFDVVGVQDLDGVPSLVLRAEPVTLWFQGGIPYPVQMDIVAETPGPGGDGLWRLTGFVRGEAPLAPGSLPRDLALPPIELAPRTLLGPDASGADLPFTLVQAFEQAAEATAEFRQAHPDHYVSKADLLEDRVYEDGTLRVERVWSFVLRGDAVDLGVQVRQPREDQPTDVERLLFEGPMSGPDEGSVETDLREAAVSTGDCRPDVLPTVASVARRWQATNGDGRAATGYGFSLGCERDQSVVASVDAGDAWPASLASYGGLPFILPPEEVHERLSGLVVRADGGVDHLWMLDVTTAGESWTSVPDLVPAQQVSNAPRPAPTPAWTLPSKPLAASITIVSVLAGLAYLLWPVVKGGSLGLFSRMQSPELMDHPIRKELVQRIEAQPGVHYQDLVRAMGKGKGTIEHHLRKLQEGGFVKSVPAGGYTCFFPVAYDRRLTGTAPALKSEGARKVLAAIRAQPGASAMQVAAVTGLSPAAINHHLQRLGAAGLVDVLRNGRSLNLQPTALAAQVDATAGA